MMLTDSGGFQVFSLSGLNAIDDDGVTFKSHLDGRKLRLTPEESMRVQALLGADVAMAFDECPPGDGEPAGDRSRALSHDRVGEALLARTVARGASTLRHRTGR
ncbi:MAG: tRNA-guanine transglycosylase [Polyangiaceae bacterium]